MTMKKTIAQLSVILGTACLAFFLALGPATCLSGCAAVKKVVRTVADVAADACQLFGTEHPQEFAYLVQQQAPELKPGFNVKEACAVITVVQPFIDSQLALQNQTAMSLRMKMQSPEATDAPAPQ